MLQKLADAVLLLHFAVVAFVLTGLLLIVIGNMRKWQVVNTPLFRWTHLGAIGVVVLQSWFGIECPLTTLENWLRKQSGGVGYNASFIEDWVSAVLFFHAPAWVFAVVYTAFGLAVLAAWIKWPPRRRRQS